MRVAAFVTVAILLAGCRAAEPEVAVTPGAAPQDRDTTERPNLLNIAYGASVVSRTAEIELEHSALRAIDGESAYPESKYAVPPRDPNQTLVYGLPALTRIEELGMATLPGVFSAGSPAFEVSADGTSFTRVALPPFEPKLDLQLKKLAAPVEARYVRVVIGENAGPYATLRSLQVRGRFAEQPAVAPIAGCWTVNGLQASFVENNGDVRGSIGSHVLHGGRGAVYRFVWTNGPTWGHALVTLSPDGKHLSGLKWFEEPIAYDAAESWFGERCNAAPVAPGGTLQTLFLARAKRYPLYGNAVETVLNVLRQAPSQRIRLVSREYRAATSEANRTKAKERLDRLRADLQSRGADLGRIEFVVAGSDNPRQPIENESMRVLYGAIEIEQ